MKTILLSLCAMAILCSCSNNAATTASLSSALTSAAAKLDKAGALVGGSSRAMSRRPFRTGLSTVWTTADGVNALSNDGNETLQDWIEHMFDASFVNSNSAKVTFAGRVTSALQILCYVANAGLTADTSNLPEDGTHTITVTAEIEETCGAARRGMRTETVEATVTTLSDTTIFEKSFSIVMPEVEECPFKFLAKATSSDINLSTAEDQNCDGRNQASRSIFRYNAATQVTRFTYISQNFDGGSRGFEFYRGILDEAVDESQILGIYGGQTDGTLSQYVSFTAAGKPTAGGTTAMSTKILGQSIADGVYNACISATDSSVITDDSLACTLTGTDITTAFTVVTDTQAESDEVGDLTNIGATTDVPFTDATDIYTMN